MGRIPCVAIAVLLLAGARSQGEDVEENKRIVQRLYDEYFFKWDFAVVDEVVSPDFVGHEMPPGTPRGPEGIRQFYDNIRAGLPDVRLTVEDMIGEKDKVVVRWSARGTHGGTFLGIPATGKAVSLTGLAMYRLSKGKIVERWAEVNLLAISEQLRPKGGVCQ